MDNLNTKSIFRTASASVLATLLALVVTLAAGHFAWPVVRGVPGIAIGLVVSVGIAWLLRIWAGWSVSILSSGVGAIVACYFAIATAEVVSPETTQWIWKAGIYGGSIGSVVAAVLSPLALIKNRQ